MSRPVVQYKRRNGRQRADPDVDSDAGTKKLNVDASMPDMLPRKKRRLIEDEDTTLQDAKMELEAPRTKKGSLLEGGTPKVTSARNRNMVKALDLPASDTTSSLTTPPPESESKTSPSPSDKESSPVPSLSLSTPQPRPSMKRASTTATSFKRQGSSPHTLSSPRRGTPQMASSSSTATPQKERDLFAPFQFQSKSVQNSPTRNRGVARRMLSRSKTESSIPTAVEEEAKSDDSPKRLGLAKTLPNFSSTSQIPEADEPSGSQVDPFQSGARARKQPAHTKTYANARSFLVPLQTLPPGVDSAVKNEDGDAARDELDEELHRESYVDLRTRYGVDETEANENAIVMKSVTELRSKGESRRFMDEVGWLVEGLDPDGPQGIARSSAIEILEKMLEPDGDFIRRAKAVDYVGRIWHLMDTCRGNGDIVIESAMTFYAALIAREMHDLDDLDSVVDFLCLALEVERDRDPLYLAGKAGEGGKGRRNAESKSLMRLSELIRRSGMADSSETSRPSLASLALQTPHPQPQRVISAASKALTSALMILSATLEETPMPSEENIMADVPLKHTERCLSIIDSGRSDSDDALFNGVHGKEKETIAKGLVRFCAVSFAASLENGSGRALRILVDLTNNNAEWCTLIHPHLCTVLQVLRWSSDEKNKDREALDNFCFALGMLTNIIRELPEARDSFRGFDTNATCVPSLVCAIECQCEQGDREVEGAIPFLVSRYERHALKAAQKPTIEDTFLTGHVAVLLGLLCEGNEPNQRVLLNSLSGLDKLDNLINHVELFADSYGVMLCHLAEGNKSHEEHEDMDVRLKPDPVKIDAQSSVAHRVSALLRRIRDALLARGSQ